MKLIDGIAHIDPNDYDDALAYEELKAQNRLLVDAYGNEGFLLRGYFYKIKLVEKINDN